MSKRETRKEIREKKIEDVSTYLASQFLGVGLMLLILPLLQPKHKSKICKKCGHEICEECRKNGVIWCDTVLPNGDLCCDGGCEI